MRSRLEAEQVQGHLKVIWAFITGLASNLVHVVTIEGRICSRSSQGHLHIITGLASNLVGLHVITVDGQTSCDLPLRTLNVKIAKIMSKSRNFARALAKGTAYLVIAVSISTCINDRDQ